MNDQTPISSQDKLAVAESEEVLHISQTMTRMRLMMGRRVIGRMAIAKLAPGLELSHIDVLDIIRRSEGEVTVGAIAEGMRIDPSRGSRVVSDMVDGGMLERAVSQQDARRSILKITPLGESLLAEIHSVKIGIIGDMMQGWHKDDIATFSVLFERFIKCFEKRLSPDAKPSGES